MGWVPLLGFQGRCSLSQGIWLKSMTSLQGIWGKMQNSGTSSSGISSVAKIPQLCLQRRRNAQISRLIVSSGGCGSSGKSGYLARIVLLMNKFAKCKERASIKLDVGSSRDSVTDSKPTVLQMTGTHTTSIFIMIPCQRCSWTKACARCIVGFFIRSVTSTMLVIMSKWTTCSWVQIWHGNHMPCQCESLSMVSSTNQNAACQTVYCRRRSKARQQSRLGEPSKQQCWRMMASQTIWFLRLVMIKNRFTCYLKAFLRSLGLRDKCAYSHLMKKVINLCSSALICQMSIILKWMKVMWPISWDLSID